MKRSTRKKSVVVAAASIIVLLFLIGLMPWRLLTNPRFKFLNGRSPMSREKSESRITYYYSFESDFNSLSNKAIVELDAKGFRDTGYGPPQYDFYRASDKTRVTILDQYRYELNTTPEISDYPDLDKGKFHYYEDGWVSVVISQEGPHAPLIRVLYNLTKRMHHNSRNL